LAAQCKKWAVVLHAAAPADRAVCRWCPQGAKKGFFGGPASPTKPKVTAKAKPLSPGSNYP
jgi:hypothetical protein